MKIIIAGAYAIGTHLAQLLSRNNEDTVLIDSDEERLASISSEYDLMTVHASVSKIQTLKDAGVSGADLFIAVTRDENLNMNACMLAKALGAKRTVAKVDNFEYIDPKLDGFFEKVGISSRIYPENLAARDIANGLKMSWVRQRWDVHDGALVMLGIKLRETCEILNEPLKDLCKPESPYHIVAIKRGDETIIPRGDDVLKIYDLAYFMTTRNYIPYIRKIVGKEHYVDVKNVMIMGGGATAVRATELMPEYMNAKIIELDEARCQRNQMPRPGRTMQSHSSSMRLNGVCRMTAVAVQPMRAPMTPYGPNSRPNVVGRKFLMPMKGPYCRKPVSCTGRSAPWSPRRRASRRRKSGTTRTFSWTWAAPAWTISA